MTTICNTPNNYGLDHETRSLKSFINDYERAERARKKRCGYSFKDISFLSIVCKLLNHILVNATYHFFLYNTPNNYGLDHETKSLKIWINDYERAERAE